MTSAVLLPPSVMSDCGISVRESFALGIEGESTEGSRDEENLTSESSKLGANSCELMSDSHNRKRNTRPVTKDSNNIIIEDAISLLGNSDDNSNLSEVNGAHEKTPSETVENGIEERPTLRLRNMVEIGASPPVTPAESVSELIILSDVEDDDQDNATGDKPKEGNSSLDHSYSASENDVIKNNKFIISKKSKNGGAGTLSVIPPRLKECLQCNETVLCSHSLVLNSQETAYLCSSACIIANKVAQQNSLNRVNATSAVILSSQKGNPGRQCSTCQKDIEGTESTLSWETMDYCNDECLKLYFNKMGNLCSMCKKPSSDASLGKYSVRFGCDIRQFCQAQCLEDFKKNLKVCSYCQEDISTVQRFDASIQNKIVRDFCGKDCVHDYERMNSSTPIRQMSRSCAVCSKTKLVTVEVAFGDEQFKLCSEVCFSAFKFVHPFSKMGFCDLCKKYFDLKAMSQQYFMYHDDAIQMFCSKVCFNVFIMMKRKIVQCNWCKVKKYNFDMIKQMFCNKQVIMYCSINCYSTWKASPKRNICDNCSVFGVIMYHLGMSDGTLRSFCGQDCLMKFQLQFKKTPVTPDNARPISKSLTSNAALNADSPVLSVANAASATVENGCTAETDLDTPAPAETTVEAAVASVNPAESTWQTKVVKLGQKQTGPQTTSAGMATAICQVVFIPREQPKMCNKMTMYSCKGPSMKSKSAMCCPITHSKCTQTDFESEEKVISSSDATFTVTTSSTDGEIESEDLDADCPLNRTYVVCKGKPEKRTMSIDGSEGGGGKRRRLNSDSSGSGAAGGNSSIGGASGSGNQCPPGGSGGSGDRPPTPTTPPSPPTPPSPEHKYLKKEFGVNAWKRWAENANPAVAGDPLSIPSNVLGSALSRFITSLRQDTSVLPVDAIFYLCLGIQDYLRSSGRVVDIFAGSDFEPFIETLDNMINTSSPDPLIEMIGPRVEEEHLWEACQLGPFSPWTLLTTLIFYNTKYFHIDSVEGHKSLCMSHIMKHWKRGNDSSRTNRLVYYPPSNAANVSSSSNLSSTNDDSHSGEENKKTPREQVEDTVNSLRCPVKLYEYYLSKCCDNVKGRGDAFYLVPEVNVSPQSPTWYTTDPLPSRVISMILGRISLVKETYLCLR